MRLLRLLMFVLAMGFMAASCTQDETMEELLQDTELEQPATDDEPDNDAGTEPDPGTGGGN